MIQFVTFGKSTMTPRPKMKRVMSCLTLSNPHNVHALRQHDGRHTMVKDFVANDKKFAGLYGEAKEAVEALADGDTMGFYCFGGKHRSVAMAELLAAELRGKGTEVKITHLELGDIHGTAV